MSSRNSHLWSYGNLHGTVE